MHTIMYTVMYTIMHTATCTIMYTVMYTIMRTITYTIMYIVMYTINVKCILYVHDVQLVEIDPSGVGPAPYGFSIKKAKKTGLLKTVSLKTVPERVSFQTGVFAETVFSVCGRLSALNT